MPNIHRRMDSVIIFLRDGFTINKNHCKVFCFANLIIRGVEPYERVDKEVCAKMVELAADCSMAKAAKALGCEVSRQTVNNKLLAMEDVVTDVSRQD